MKMSEARILVYLNNADKPLRYAKKMSEKLDIEYKYLLNVLGAMIEKGWIAYYRLGQKKNFTIIDQSKIYEAKTKISEMR